jgi:hypothetical protein
MQNETILLRSARRKEEVHKSSGRTGSPGLLSALLVLSLLVQGCPATVRAQAPNSASSLRVEAAVIAGSGLAPGFGSTGQPPHYSAHGWSALVVRSTKAGN